MGFEPTFSRLKVLLPKPLEDGYVKPFFDNEDGIPRTAKIYESPKTKALKRTNIFPGGFYKTIG